MSSFIIIQYVKMVVNVKIVYPSFKSLNYQSKTFNNVKNIKKTLLSSQNPKIF